MSFQSYEFASLLVVMPDRRKRMQYYIILSSNLMPLAPSIVKIYQLVQNLKWTYTHTGQASWDPTLGGIGSGWLSFTFCDTYFVRPSCSPSSVTGS